MAFASGRGLGLGGSAIVGEIASRRIASAVVNCFALGGGATLRASVPLAPWPVEHPILSPTSGKRDACPANGRCRQQTSRVPPQPDRVAENSNVRGGPRAGVSDPF